MSRTDLTDAGLGRLGYSVREVAQSLGCSEKHVQNLIRDGVIPSLKLGERRLVRADDLRKVLNDRVEGGKQAA